ncbi:MAG TPA: AAA family ATPase [Anaerolineales bacterium]|nr:AAA family ATPase [Anaerolineales bacterium]
MSFELTIRNYRCFEEPINLSIGANLTALIGINNSGKSSILRFFYEFRDLFQNLLNAIEGNGLNNILGQPGNRQSFNTVSTISDYDDMFCDLNKEGIEFTISWTDQCVNSKKQHQMKMNFSVERAHPTWHAELRIDSTRFLGASFGAISLKEDLIEWGNRVTTNKLVIHSIFKSLIKTQYIGSHRNILNANPSGTRGGKNYFDLEMGSSFVERWRMLKSGPKRSDYELAAKVTEDIRRIFGYQHLEINAWYDNQTLQVIIDGRTYQLGELGSGIAQFIVVFANAALARPSFILIDEPETNLHTSLQSDFLASLASYATEGIVFATHNAGLALSCADRIYSVRRTQSTSRVSIYEQTPRLSEFLGELGYAAYKDLGFDKVLLVEGPSEVKVLWQWLRLYGLSHKVVLLHLGGSSSINGHSDAELQEIKRISPNVFALIDSERTHSGADLEPAREAFLATCRGADIQCFITERRATENYFTEDAIKKAFGKFRALREFEALKEMTPRWRKNENWRIAARMTLDELRDTDVHKVFTALASA